MAQCRAHSGERAFGLEAIEVPTLVHLIPGDTIATVGNHWLSAKIRENPLARMMAELFPENNGNALPHLIADTKTSSARVSLGTGVAFAYKVQGLSNIAVVFGDRSIMKEPVADALLLAGEKRLPIIFVTESKVKKGMSSTALRKLDDEMNATAAQCGFPAIPVDGCDAVAVFRVAQEAISRARKGGGPTLIDCKVWHGATDAIAHIEAYMNKRGI